jgi:hypothetical protein
MPDPRPTGLLERTPAWVVPALVAAHVAAAVFLAIGAARGPVQDAYVVRAEIVATSPAIPYRGFPMVAMPLETAAFQLLGGHGAGRTAVSFVVLALVADLATAAALAVGWNRRAAIVYLLLGLPLLGFAYLRLDLVAVALATWAVALLRRRGDDPVGGVVFGLAVFWKLWPLALAPLLLFRRAVRAGTAFVVVGLLGGAVWYLTGGPKGPFQVLTFRAAQGWSVESTVGSLRWIAGGGPANPDGATVRLGTSPLWQLAALGIVLLVAEALVWWRGYKDDADPTGAASLAAVAALLAFAPVQALQYGLWLLPWTAIAFEGEARERTVATLATVVIVLDGVLSLVYGSVHAYPSGTSAEVLLVARNLACVATVGAWLWPRRAPAPAGAHVAA